MTTMAVPRLLADEAGSPRGELDAVTVARCRAGDREAFRRFVLAYERLVFAFLGRMLDAASVDDVAQDAFVRAFRAIRSFDPAGPARLSTWMLAIARRAALDHGKRARRHRVEIVDVDALSAEGSPENEASRRELGRTLETAARSLPDEQREAFVLFELQGLSLEEVAVVVGAPVPTVKTRLFRAREKLRDFLRSTHEEANR